MLSFHFRTKLQQRGDTIVEVMVVLAILGLALGISYATANRSLLAVRSAQENATASEILQSQLETLRALSTNASAQSQIFQTANSFCVSTDDATVTAIPSQDLTDYPNYPPDCQQPNAPYSIAISYDGTSTFTFTAHWDDLGGQSVDSSTLVYRLYKPAVAG